MLRVHRQLFFWLRLDCEIVENISFEGNGWHVEEDTNTVKPVWFTGISFYNFILNIGSSDLEIIWVNANYLQIARQDVTCI